MVPIAAMTIATAHRDGHDQSDDGCHDDETDGCRQYGCCSQRVTRVSGCHGDVGGTSISLAAFVCREGEKLNSCIFVQI